MIPIENRGVAPVDEQPLLSGEGATGFAALAGRIVVVNFWAAWCGPCRDEQPELNEAFKTYAGEAVAFLGVNVQDSEPNARAHVREFNVAYDSLVDPFSAFSAKFGGIGAEAIPTTVLLDRQGRVAVRLFGSTNAGELGTLIARLLDESESAAGVIHEGAALSK